jgi:hypothetical protein
MGEQRWAGHGGARGERPAPSPQEPTDPSELGGPLGLAGLLNPTGPRVGTAGFTHIEEKFQDPGEPRLALLAGNSSILVLHDPPRSRPAAGRLRRLSCPPRATSCARGESCPRPSSLARPRSASVARPAPDSPRMRIQRASCRRVRCQRDLRIRCSSLCLRMTNSSRGSTFPHTVGYREPSHVHVDLLVRVKPSIPDTRNLIFA